MNLKLAPIVSIAIMLVAAAPVRANPGASASGDVTVSSPCILVSADATQPTSDHIDYGTLQFSQAYAGGEKTSTGHPQFENCSSDFEKVFIRGTDATSTEVTPTGPAARWSLAGEGLNSYGHHVNGTFNGFELTLVDQLYSPSVSSGAGVPLTSTFTMPLVGSDGAGQTMTFSIVFTASL